MYEEDDNIVCDQDCGGFGRTNAYILCNSVYSDSSAPRHGRTYLQMSNQMDALDDDIFVQFHDDLFVACENNDEKMAQSHLEGFEKGGRHRQHDGYIDFLQYFVSYGT